MIACTTLVLLLLSLAGPSQPSPVQPEPLETTQWAPVHYLVYDTDGPFRRPDRVLFWLKKLDEIYEPYSDKETNGRKETIKELLLVAERDPRNCNTEFLLDFKELMNTNSPYRLTLIPYLGHHYQEYLTLCEQSMVSNLHLNVANLGKLTRRNIEHMANKTNTIEVGGKSLGAHGVAWAWLFTDHLIRALLEYLDDKTGGALLPHKGPGAGGSWKWQTKKGRPPPMDKKSFYELYNEHVIESCAAWYMATRDVEVFSHLDIDLRLSEEERLWMEYSHFCFVIGNHGAAYRGKVYGEYKRRVSALPGLRKLLHRTFRPLNFLDPL